MKIVILGGGAGGASVAARARRLDEHAEIVLVDKRSEISQATCGLPYYIGDSIKDRNRLVVVSVEEFANLLKVDVRTRTELAAISRADKTVTLVDLDRKTQHKESYDKLVLAPGSAPVVPDISGIHRTNVFTLQSTEDVDAIKFYLNNNACQKAVIVGAGFIGMEMADNLKQLGLDVTVVERASQVMGSLDKEMAGLVQTHLDQQGVRLILNESITAVSRGAVVLESGKLLESDIVILSLGMRPMNALAVQCNLELGPRGGIATNDDLTTSDRDIYALGDSAELNNAELGERTLLQLAGPAQKQASVVADNLFGGCRVYRMGAGTAIAKVFDLTVATTGRSERQLVASGTDYQKSYADLVSHASYYPNATPLTIKLLFSPVSGQALGAQIVGFEGVDKRIDVLASAVQFGRSVSELAELDLAYAPPYSSAKDPVNVAGMIARNMIEHDYQVIFWDEFDRIEETNTVVLDVRTNEEREIDFVPNSLHIPLEHLRERINEIPKEKRIAVYCQLGKKGYFAYRILRQNGFDNVCNLSGGYKLLKSATGQAPIQGSDLVPGTGLDVKNGVEEMIRVEIDATGLSCPGPIMKLTQGIKKINDGEFLLISASDPAFSRDVETWCRKTGHSVHSTEKNRAITRLLIKKNME